VRPDAEPLKYLRVGYGQLDGLAHEGDGLAHPADVLVACLGHVARARRRARSRHDPDPTLAHALREALEEALLRVEHRSLFRSGVVVLGHGPAR
jgi:hypothetical protein